MKSVIMVIGVVILLLFSGTVLTSLNSFRMEDFTEDHIVAAGAAFADVTLSQDLFDDATRNATVTSNETADAPISSTYTTATNVLRVTGLDAGLAHRLTVDYKIDRLAEFLGIQQITLIVPALYFLGILGIIGGAVYVATRRGD